MKRILVLLAGMMLITTAAFAFGLGDIKAWIGWQGVSYILAFLLALGGIGGTVMFIRIVQTMKEGSEFLAVLATALASKDTSPATLKKIVAEGKDVWNVWAKTPDKYIPNA